MADTKITALTADTSPDGADLVVTVDDVGGTPTNKKTTIENLSKGINATNITNGTLPVGTGGTGQTSYTDGQLLIGNTTGNTLAKATLSEGEGIDITNGTGTITIAAETATDSNPGISELAIASEVNTGTDTERAITPDALAGSNYGIRCVQIPIYVDATVDMAIGDGAGSVRFFIPSELNGFNLVSAHATVITAGTTGTCSIQIHNVTDSQDMLSTAITIDSGEKTSYTAATAPVINTSYDDVATGDELRFDIDGVHTTPAKGASVLLSFQLP